MEQGKEERLQWEKKKANREKQTNKKQSTLTTKHNPVPPSPGKLSVKRQKNIQIQNEHKC